MKETIAYLKSLLKDGDTIVIGLSGGPDSMCLLDIIRSLNKSINVFSFGNQKNRDYKK